MTDWLRAFAYTLLGLFLLACLFVWGWVAVSRDKLRKFRNERPTRPWF